MTEADIKARVFISCGQRKNSDEVNVAHGIEEKLKSLGFDPYLAVVEQTLAGLKENIFQKLGHSDYFVFVDFVREQLDGGPAHRGSLFSHQELALAAYLELPLVAFHEKGVKSPDGLMGCLQANSREFTDRPNLPDIVANVVHESCWNPRSRNQLSLEATHWENAWRIDRDREKPALARFFQVEVQNPHNRRLAMHCRAYLESACAVRSSKMLPLEIIEHKWSGYILPDAAIGPGLRRCFDAFYVFHDSPCDLRFNVFTDATSYVPPIAEPGEYRLTYIVVSEGFPVARRSFSLRFGGALDEIVFKPM